MEETPRTIRHRQGDDTARAPSVSVVIPAHNEEESVAHVLRDCLAVLPRCADRFDITVIDDGSTDGTAKRVHEMMADHPGTIRLVTHPRRLGFADACDAAFRAGMNDWVILLHADGQYPPSMLLDAVPLLATHDAVLFVRRHKYYRPLRGMLSWGYRLLPRLLFGLDLKDPGGSKAIRRELIERIPVTSRGIFRDPERIVRAHRLGYRIGFLTVDILPRVTGTAQGQRMRQAWEAAGDMARLWMRERQP